MSGPDRRQAPKHVRIPAGIVLAVLVAATGPAGRAQTLSDEWSLDLRRAFSASDTEGGAPTGRDGSGAVPPSGEGAALPGEDGTPLLALRLTASGWLASIDGYVQTPTGGGAGTTSQERPTTEEIGLDGLHVHPLVDVSLFVHSVHEVHLQFLYVGRDGTATLSEELISQGETFPAGSEVQSDLQLPFGRIGYRARWLPLTIGDWSLEPELGLGIFAFSYELASPSATGPVDRSYTVAFPYLGILAAGPVAGPLSLETEISGSWGINGVTYVDAEARLVYEILREPTWSTAVVLGLKGTWLRRRDGQSPEHNDVNLRIGSFSTEPWAGLTFGLRVSF